MDAVCLFAIHGRFLLDDDGRGGDQRRSEQTKGKPVGGLKRQEGP